LFFKELKSTLGLDQYRFREFVKVERWVELCLITFVYLEWYRAEQLSSKALSEKQRKWWQVQRAHGLCVSIRQATEEKELERLAEYTKTPSGIRKLKKILRAARPTEHRQAM
jgi:hypothetical protein